MTCITRPLHEEDYNVYKKYTCLPLPSKDFSGAGRAPEFEVSALSLYFRGLVIKCGILPGAMGFDGKNVKRQSGFIQEMNSTGLN